VKSKDGVPGTMWALDVKSEWGGSAHAVLATWKREEMEIGVWLHCPTETKRKFEQGFASVVKSFRFFDAQADDVEDQPALDGLPLTPRKKREIERGLVQGWALIVSPAKNYVVLYNTKANRNHQLAKMIAERIEAIRAQVYEVRFPPARKIETVCLVRICGDRAEYHAYGGPGGSAGYWNSDAEELVFYDASPSRKVDDDTLSVLYHEAFHQYIHYSVGEVAPHSWFNEGHGDYFAGARYVGGKFVIKPFAWRVETIRNAVRAGPSPYEVVTGEDARVKFDRSQNGYSPLQVFVGMSQGEYYSYPSVSYAQGWSLVYFLREAVPKNSAWNAKWGRILDTYFTTLKDEIAKDRPPERKKPKDDDAGPEKDGPGTPPAPTTPTGPTKPPGDGPGAPAGPADPADPAGPGEPGDEGDKPADSEPEFDPATFIPPVSRYESSRRALEAALKAAFAGVDFEELEAAWRKYTQKVG
jgi:hypothetical protein